MSVYSIFNSSIFNRVSFFALAVLLSSALLSCSGGGGQEVADASVAASEQAEVVYDLPTEWSRLGSLNDAYWEKPLSEGVPFSKFEYLGAEPGSEADARTKGVHAYQLWTGESCESFPCSQEEEEYQLKSLNIDDYTLFIFKTPSYYYGAKAWTNTFAFVKEGIVYQFTLYGEPIESYEKELTVLLNSVQVNH